jgi:hypothetical protein
MLSNEELLIVLRRQITFDRYQKATAIDQTTGGDGRVDQDRLFGLLQRAATELPVRLSITYISLACYNLISAMFKTPVLSQRNNSLSPKYHSINAMKENVYFFSKGAPKGQ